MNITKKIDELRKEKGWSVAELSRKCNIPTVSLRVMLNRDNPNNYNVKALIKIAETLDTSVSYLTSENKNDIPTLSEQQQDSVTEAVAKVVKGVLSGKRNL
ncbi:MAG: helix-turn-helix transcriptional regulator [Bacteroidota bacterium]|nr:helix-turn-helix transcriptional regulator [Bacteroidota bacterium]